MRVLTKLTGETSKALVHSVKSRYNRAMRKILVWVCLCALLLPSSGMSEEAWRAMEGIIPTGDGYRRVAFNEIGEALLLGVASDEEDGLVQNVGVSILLFASQEGEEVRNSAILSGDGLDKLEQAVATEGGWMAAGSTSSSDLGIGWHPGNYDNKEGKTDGWVVRLDENGEMVWSRSYGGSDWDSFNAICEAHDGGWIVVGNTYSSDGDVVGWHDSGELFTQPDAWVLHIDAEGEILWQKTLGGSGYDELLSVKAVPDGYLAVGATDSQDGDVGETHGDRDGWVVLLDTEGSLLRSVCYGGESDDSFAVISDGPEGWLAAGRSWSFELGESRRDNGWAVRLDAQGDMLWETRFGGDEGFEYSRYVSFATDFWVVAGYTPNEEKDIHWAVGIREDGSEWKVVGGHI